MFFFSQNYYLLRPGSTLFSAKLIVVCMSTDPPCKGQPEQAEVQGTAEATRALRYGDALRPR